MRSSSITHLRLRPYRHCLPFVFERGCSALLTLVSLLGLIALGLISIFLLMEMLTLTLLLLVICLIVLLLDYRFRIPLSGFFLLLDLLSAEDFGFRVS